MGEHAIVTILSQSVLICCFASSQFCCVGFRGIKTCAEMICQWVGKHYHGEPLTLFL